MLLSQTVIFSLFRLILSGFNSQGKLIDDDINSALRYCGLFASCVN